MMPISEAIIPANVVEAQQGKSILVAVEHHVKHAGFMAAEIMRDIAKEHIHSFLHRHLRDGQKVRADEFSALNAVAKSHEHQKKNTPPEEASVWLPLVRIEIGNLKTFLNGTFHGVSGKYLPGCLAEFSYRFNRRFRSMYCQCAYSIPAWLMFLFNL